WGVRGMAECVDLDHGRDDGAGDERVAHAAGGLDDTVADIADVEDPGFPARLVHAVADLLLKPSEVKRPRVAHAVGALHQDLRFGEIFLGPVHPEAERVSLMVDQAQPLAAERRSGLSHPPYLLVPDGCGGLFRVLRRLAVSTRAGARDEAVDFLSAGSGGVAGGGQGEGAVWGAVCDRHLEPEVAEQPEDQARGEAVAAADPVENLQSGTPGGLRDPAGTRPRDRAPVVDRRGLDRAQRGGDDLEV